MLGLVCGLFAGMGEGLVLLVEGMAGILAGDAVVGMGETLGRLLHLHQNSEILGLD